MDGGATLFTKYFSFIIQAPTVNEKSQKETFKLMEKRLFFYIMNPAMILSWLFGLYLIHIIGTQNLLNFWLQIKLIG